MKYEKTIEDNHQAKVHVDVEPDQLESAKRKAARKLAERGKIPGFRPGKAPYETILRYYGEPVIYEQAVDLLVDEIYPLMLKETGISPAAAGSLEKIDGKDLPQFTFLVPLAPEVDPGKYQDVRLPYEFTEPGEDKLDEAVEELRQMYGTTETVEREARQGDYLLVDLKSENKNLTRSGFATMARTEDRDNEFPFQGFARQLLGLKAGEAKTIHHHFAKDHPNEALAGQEADIEATLKTVRAVTLPDLNDDFAKMVGQYQDLQALKDALTKDILARAREEYDGDYFARLVDKIKENATIKYASQTLDHEAEHVVDEMRQRLAQQGLDLETYYKMRSTDAGKFMEEEAKPVARKRLERSLILDEISRREKIEVDNSGLDEEFNTTLLNLQMQGVNLNNIRGGKQGQQRVAEAVAMESATRLLTRRTLDRLKSIATGEYVSAGGANDPQETSSAPEAGKPSKKSAGKTARPAASKKTGTGKSTKKK